MTRTHRTRARPAARRTSFLLHTHPRPGWRPSSRAHQLAGRAVLGDPTVVKDQDPVRDRDRGQPVRDDHRGPAGQHGAQRGLHLPLARDVEQRRGLVEDEHGGGGQERPRERDQLALPGRQPAAALADRGVVALRQRRDEVVRSDHPGGLLHVRGGRVRAAEPDVVRDRALEQEVLLGDHDDLGPEHGVGQLPQVNPVQGDPARAGVVEPAEQPRDRRLARAGLADHGDRLPGRYVQVQPGQHEVVPVAEGHRLEPHLPSGRARSRGQGRR